jgi:Zn-dependent protease
MYGCDRGDPHSGELATRVTYQPGEKGWAGGVWQWPENNWGQSTDTVNLSWANKITFWAKGAQGGERVRFFAGGLGADGQPHPDSMMPEASTGMLSLTGQWQQYTLNLAGRDLSQVVGGFGWAKPVQVNVNRLRPRVLADICVSLAGVTINFLLAVFFLLIGIWLARNPMLGAYQNTTIEMLETTINVNVWMVGFNLLPIPPLDGFRVVRYLLPSHMENVVNNLYRMGPFLLMLVFFTGLGDTLLGPVYGAINAALDAIVRIVY